MPITVKAGGIHRRTSMDDMIPHKPSTEGLIYSFRKILDDCDAWPKRSSLRTVTV